MSQKKGKLQKGLAAMLATLMIFTIFTMLPGAVMKAEAAETTLNITNGSIELNDGNAIQNGNTYYANDFIITGSIDVQESNDYHILVNSGTHNVTLDNLGIFNYQHNYAAQVSSGATLNLTLKGKNYLCSYRCGVYVAKGATFSVTGTDSDELHTFASYGGAAIGGIYLNSWSRDYGYTSSGTIYIKGGRITATGGYGAAGIGGAYEGANSGGIYISGGTVNAKGGSYSEHITPCWVNGAGIGGGGYGSGGNIVISGGTVTANAQDTYNAGAGIGGGNPYYGDYTHISVTGGSVLASSASASALGVTPTGLAGSSAYLTAITIPDAASNMVTFLTVTQDGQTLGYGSADMLTDSSGKLYLYLPVSTSVTTVNLTAGGKSYSYSGTIRANNSNVLKLNWPDTFSIVGNDKYTYEDPISFSTSGGPSTGKVTYTYSGTDNLTGQTISDSQTVPSDIGSYTVTATMTDVAYNDLTATKNFTISEKGISSLTVNSPGNQTYTGEDIKPDVIIKDGSYKLIKDKDYTLSYNQNINYKDVSAQTIQRPILINGIGNYSGMTMTTFCIVPKKITLGLTVLPNYFGYAGDDITLTATAYNIVDMPQGTVKFSLGSSTSSAYFTKDSKGSYTAVVTFKKVLSNVFNITANYVQSSLQNYICPQAATISGYYVVKNDQTNFKFANGCGYAISGGVISKTYGNGDFALQTSGHLSSKDITFTSTHPSVATVDSNGKVRILKSGRVCIQAVSPEDDLYNQATSSVEIDVSEAGQPDFTITDGDGYAVSGGVISKTYGEGDFTLQTSGRLSSKAVAFFSSDPSVAAVDENGKITIIRSGKTDITTTSPEDGRYYGVTSKVSILVSKAAQSNFAFSSGADYAIACGTISKTYGDGDFALEISGHLSSNKVTFSSSDTSVAMVDSNGKVTILKSGDTTITADSPTDDRYYTATATVRISVGKANQSDFAFTGGEDYTIENGTVGKTYGDRDFTLQTSGRLSSCGIMFSSSDPTVAMVDGSGKVTILKSGGTTITADSPTDDRYYKATANVKITVSKATQRDFTITGGDRYAIVDGVINKTYGDGNFTLQTSGRLSSCGISFSSSDPTVATVDGSGNITVLKGGKTTIMATSLADDKYKEAVGTIIMNIGKANTAIKIAPTVSAEIPVVGKLSFLALTGGEGSVTGSFGWTNPNTVVSENGEYDVTFTPTDSTDYSSCTCKVPVKVTPVITNSGTGVQYDLTNTNLPDRVTSVSIHSSVVSEAGSSSSTYSVINKLIDGSTSSASSLPTKLYNLSLMDQNNQAITGFTGKITVRIPIPSGMSGNLHVYWYNDYDGTVTDMNAKQENGFLVFETTHFSYYAVAKLTAKSTPGSDGSLSNNISSSDSSSETTPSPDTGSSSFPLLSAALLGSSMCGLCIVTRGRKFRKKNQK